VNLVRLLSLAVVLALAWAAAATGAAEKSLKTWSGGATPALRLNDLDGRPQDISAYRGKALLVNFWATWCEPCREELPSMNRLKERFRDRPFEVLAVDVGDRPDRVRGFLEKLPVAFPVLLDEESTSMRDWRVRGLPTSFVLDPEGRIRYWYVGELDWSAPGVVSAIEGILPARR
jgi:thiol-disulfide isomerase/thioredoxin